jgi:hypothetical protein
LNKFIFLILISSFTLNSSFAQKLISNSAYITFYAGDLSILSEEFTEFYNSKNALIFGVGFGVPINNTLSIDASASYFQKKSNYTLPTDLNSLNSAILKQVIFSTGLKINFIPQRVFGLSFLSGIKYAYINEERKNAKGVYLHEIEGSGNLGVYIGAEFELSLGKGPVAIYGETKYSYSWNPILEFEDTYRELTYAAGIKIYFSKRW